MKKSGQFAAVKEHLWQKSYITTAPPDLTTRGSHKNIYEFLTVGTCEVNMQKVQTSFIFSTN